MSSSFMEELSFESESKQAEHLQRQARRQLSALANLMRAYAANSHVNVRWAADVWQVVR